MARTISAVPDDWNCATTSCRRAGLRTAKVFPEELGAHWPAPLGRAQLARAISLLEDYRPEMEVSAPWEMRGKPVEFRMFYRGKDFDDPEFIAFGYSSDHSIE